jgi:hypothetical protein
MFPDERERYGPAGAEWCRHDSQHLLNWAVLSLTQDLDYERELSWLARVLEARNFPLPRLAGVRNYSHRRLATVSRTRRRSRSESGTARFSSRRA